jgi:hypothetical protein
VLVHCEVPPQGGYTHLTTAAVMARAALGSRVEAFAPATPIRSGVVGEIVIERPPNARNGLAVVKAVAGPALGTVGWPAMEMAITRSLRLIGRYAGGAHDPAGVPLQRECLASGCCAY